MSEPDEIPPAGVLATPSPEATALEALERRAKWCIPGGVVPTVNGRESPSFRAHRLTFFSRVLYR